MAYTPQQRSWCVLEFAKTNCVTNVQRSFRRIHHNNPPTNKSILKWYSDFVEKGCICDQRKGHSGRKAVSEEVVDIVRDAFVRSPKNSTRRCSREIKIPRTTIHKVLRKRLRFTPYKLQLVQKLYPQDRDTRFNFCHDLQESIENDPDLLSKIIFSDEATFYLNGKVNRHNIRIWGTQNPHTTHEIERNSPKVNVFCAVTERSVYGPFFFEWPSVTGDTYLDMLQNWLLPRLQANERDDYIFQQDGAPPHWSLKVRDFLNTNLPDRWIGRAGQEDKVFHKWPPRSPDLTVCDFFLWGYVKDKVYIPPLPQTMNELLERINEAIQTITRGMLQNVWMELDYRLDTCRATRGAHIECL